jgi:hypothetical protein
MLQRTTMDRATARRSALEVMEIQIATRSVCTPDGRLLRDSDPFGDGTADRFFLGRTLEGNLWRFRYDLPDALVQELAALARSEPVCADPAAFRAEPAIAPAVRAALGRHEPIRGEYRGPAYYVPAAVPAPPRVEMITEASAYLLEASYPHLARGLSQVAPCVVALSDGAVAAVCYSSRRSDRATEAGVRTLEPHRRRGYGSAVVAGWAAAVRQRGLLPIYSTSWQNLASQGLARKLGCVLFGEDFHIK